LDLTSFLFGAVVGFVAGAIIFTATGREVVREVTVPAARAVGRRVEYAVAPRR